MKIPENVLQEKKQGNWHNVSELIETKKLNFHLFLIKVKAKQIMLLYKKKPGEAEKDQKRLEVILSEDAV